MRLLKKELTNEQCLKRVNRKRRSANRRKKTYISITITHLQEYLKHEVKPWQNVGCLRKQ